MVLSADVARDATPKLFSTNVYFTYTGCAIFVVLLSAAFGVLQKRSWDEELNRAVIAILFVTTAYAGIALAKRLRWFTWLSVALHFEAKQEERLQNALSRVYERFGWLMTAIFVIVALTLLSANHRRFVGVFAFIEASMIVGLRRPMAARSTLAISLLSITTWALSVGLTYTNVGDWVLNSNASPLAVPAFLVSFGLVITELCDERRERLARSVPAPALLAVFLIIVAFAFRSDNMLDSWVPYHRSFYADVAQLIRDGHWILWDVPSLYGFFSMLTLAAVPARNAWQGLFILTSVVIVIESCVMFALWRWGRTGWVNLFFSLLLTLATFGDAIARYPWSSRLYPQGGLRFIWVLGLMMTAFLVYVWRDKPRRVETLYWIGHTIWLISLLWAFETGVWATAIWLPYLILSTLIQPSTSGVAKRLAIRLWPLIVLPLAAFVVVQSVYVAALGHGPDWHAFVEFTGLFVSGSVRASFPTNPSGASWSIVLVLGAVGSIGIASIRRGLWAIVPLIAATWLAVWATSTYFTVEPFDGHVDFLLGVLVPAAGIVTFVSRDALFGDHTALYARLSFAPIAILCISTFLGDPAVFVKMKFPLQAGWTSDTLSTLPPISGELAHLISESGIRPGDAVVIPAGEFWTEISQGMLFPISSSPKVGPVEYRAWVPLSPLGVRETIMGLSGARRQTYVDRFLGRSRIGGWYIAYRAPANCETISKQLVTRRTFSSPNYSTALCEFKGTQASAHSDRK